MTNNNTDIFEGHEASFKIVLNRLLNIGAAKLEKDGNYVLSRNFEEGLLLLKRASKREKNLKRALDLNLDDTDKVLTEEQKKLRRRVCVKEAELDMLWEELGVLDNPQ